MTNEPQKDESQMNEQPTEPAGRPAGDPGDVPAGDAGGRPVAEPAATPIVGGPTAACVPGRAEAARLRSARARVGASFILTTLASIGFAVVYVTDAGPQLEGLCLALAFAGLAAGLTIWARQLLPDRPAVEARHPSPPAANDSPAAADSPSGHDRERAQQREQQQLVEQLGEVTGQMPRRGLFGLLGAAVSALGIAALFPAYSLAQPFGVKVGRLRKTAWEAGVRLVDSAGKPVTVEQIVEGTFVAVYPEGHTSDGDVPAFAVRLKSEDLVERPPGPDLGGLVVYSMLCTHAGCPVSLYEQRTGRVLCPCHQSVFDLRRGARRVSGPAGRPLPGLPVEADADGHLYALGDFTKPPGPGHWSYP